MKGKIVWTTLCVLGLAVGACTYSVAAHAQTPSQNPNQQAEPQQQQKTQTFLGEIVKTRQGQYALLIDKGANRGYFLDDQAKAKKFEGQSVKVTGVLEASTSTIHVSDIEPA
jgi:Protein of unknown function (DUF5818)